MTAMEELVQKQPDRETPAPKKPRHTGVALFVAGAGFAALAFSGISSRHNAAKKLEAATLAADKTIVSVIQPEKAPAVVSLALPGETQAFAQAPIYAQTNGYLRKWNYDIGAQVKAGDILAEIDTPALDQQFAQAQASVKQAQAALWLSQATYDRGANLLKNNVISSQDHDNQAGDLREKEAALATDEASLRQIEATLAFKIVQAPFAGIVSARNTDIGALINAGSGTALFTVTQVDPLRVYVNVPQNLAAAIKPGTKAGLTFDTYPGQSFPAQVVATSGAIDPGTRTLLTQLMIPNKDGKLLPGSFATVHLSIETGSPALLVPANVLLFRSEGTTVGLVNAQGGVELRKVKIGRDLGAKLEIVEGISPTDQLILNPSDSLTAGTVVQVAKAEPPPLAAK